MAENTVEDVFFPEKVVDSGFGQQDGKRYYKIRWVRYTWEAEDALSNVKELLDLFWTEHGGLQTVDKDKLDVETDYPKGTDKDEEIQVTNEPDAVIQAHVNAEETGVAVGVLLKNQNDINPETLADIQAVSNIQNVTTADDAFTTESESDKTIKYITMEKHPCDICLRTYSSAQTLRAHKKSAHKNEKSFQCETCLKCFAEKSTLRRHMYIHLEEKPFKCEHCDKGFSDKSTLRRHVITHTGHKRFQCASCDKRFTRNEHLRQHMFIHTEEKIYKCDVCFKDFRQRSTLKNHMLLHRADNAFKCDLCGALFAKQQQLDKHSIWCNGISSTFKCEHCDRSFQERSGLKRHMLLHSGERPFKCEFCDQAFNDRSVLRRHMFKHTEKKPFQCAVCSKEFLRKAHMQSHVAREHADEVNRPVFELVQSVGYDINEGISLDGQPTHDQHVRFVIQNPDASEVDNAISQVEVSSNDTQDDGVSLLELAVSNISPDVLTGKEVHVSDTDQINETQGMQLHMGQDLQPGDNQLLQVQIIQMQDGNQFVQSIQAIVSEDDKSYEHADLVVDENQAIVTEEQVVLSNTNVIENDKDIDVLDSVNHSISTDIRDDGSPGTVS